MHWETLAVSQASPPKQAATSWNWGPMPVRTPANVLKLFDVETLQIKSSWTQFSSKPSTCCLPSEPNWPFPNSFSSLPDAPSPTFGVGNVEVAPTWLDGHVTGPADQRYWKSRSLNCPSLVKYGQITSQPAGQKKSLAARRPNQTFFVSLVRGSPVPVFQRGHVGIAIINHHFFDGYTTHLW